MKKVVSKIKESLGGILISFLLSLMLAFYEPLNMFMGNLEDIWFDIYDLLPIILVQFLVAFLVLSLIFIVINLINRKAYKVVLLIAFVVSLATYIQGNFLVYNLPGLDGSQINWDGYVVDMIISVALWVVIIAASVITLRKIKFEKFAKIINGVSVAVILMLVVATVSLFTKPNVFDRKNDERVTFDNFSKISTDKNFLIFLVDQVDSVAFDKELSANWNKEEILKDFTYYPNTSSTYLWTCFSIPYILTGQYYENKEDKFSDYFTTAIDNSPLFERLEKEGYKMNLYEYEELLNYKGDKLGTRFDNIQSGALISKKQLIKQEAKYILFKYLPYQLKWIANISTLNMNATRVDEGERVFSEFDDVLSERLNNEALEKTNEKYFAFTHAIGAHPPFVYDKNANRQPEGTYQDGVNASISLVKDFLGRLRENDVYDNSVIIIMADHGHGEKTIERGNPILYIKGINEKHDYQKSDQKISYENLNRAYEQLLNGDTTDKLFNDIDNSRRRVLYSELYNPNFREMMQTGDSWDTETLVETGNLYPKKDS